VVLLEIEYIDTLGDTHVDKICNEPNAKEVKEVTAPSMIGSMCFQLPCFVFPKSFLSIHNSFFAYYFPTHGIVLV
jgi:hypothetical protein